MTKCNGVQVEQLYITLNNEAGDLGQPQIGSVKIRKKAARVGMSQPFIQILPGPDCMKLLTSLESQVCR